MFHYIEPEEHHLYKDLILSFLEGVMENSNLYDIFEDWDQATFLLTNDKIKDIRGGVLLLKQERDMLHPHTREHLRTFSPSQKRVWTGLISLQVNEGISGQDFERVCKIFYTALIAELMVFGIKENTPFLYVTMMPFEHLIIEMQDAWTYLTAVKPKASKDGLFRGVLMLVNRKREKCPQDVNVWCPFLKQEKMTAH